MFQEKLIQSIRKRINKKESLIDAISAVLDISYDAAHRRISMKSKFSIDETAILCRNFGISMDKTLLDDAHVLVQRTSDIKDFESLSTYLESSVHALKQFPNSVETKLYYSAKDIPLFYTVNADLLSKFKLYVWLYLRDFDKLELSFQHFLVKSPLLDNSLKLNNFYQDIEVHEIWNDTTINSTLQQILYFYQSGMITIMDAEAICDALNELLHHVEKKCNPKNETYKLYYHDLLILNNNVLVEDDSKKSLFVPYTMLGYFITNDIDTCKNVYEFFQHQLKNSKLINTVGTRDRKIFFNKGYQKIAFYKTQIQNLQDFA